MGLPEWQAVRIYHTVDPQYHGFSPAVLSTCGPIAQLYPITKENLGELDNKAVGGVSTHLSVPTSLLMISDSHFGDACSGGA